MSQTGECMAISSTGGPWLKNEGQAGFVTQFGGTTFCRQDEAAIVSGDGESLFPYLPALNCLDDNHSLPDVSYGYITLKRKDKIEMTVAHNSRCFIIAYLASNMDKPKVVFSFSSKHQTFTHEFDLKEI